MFPVLPTRFPMICIGAGIVAIDILLIPWNVAIEIAE